MLEGKEKERAMALWEKRWVNFCEDIASLKPGS